MTSLDDVARAGRSKRLDPELRYQGGPLDGQANTWPETAIIPTHIRMMRSGDQREGAYVLMSGGAGPSYYQWLPSA